MFPRKCDRSGVTTMAHFHGALSGAHLHVYAEDRTGEVQGITSCNLGLARIAIMLHIFLPAQHILPQSIISSFGAKWISMIAVSPK